MHARWGRSALLLLAAASVGELNRTARVREGGTVCEREGDDVVSGVEGGLEVEARCLL